MGRKNKAYRITMEEALQRRLESMQAFGESKRRDKEQGLTDDKIYSFSTYRAYQRQAGYFVKYVEEKYPDCKTLKNARKYVNEWLGGLVDEGKSAWTVSLAAKALGKVYSIKPGDKDYFTPPARCREDIQRSRGEAVRDKHFSVTNNAELINFCTGTGLRRREVASVKSEDLLSRKDIEKKIKTLEGKITRSGKEDMLLSVFKDARLFNEEYYVFVKKGKGGKLRVAPIIGPHKDEIVQRFQETPKGQKVWLHVNTNADIHDYRSKYATSLYKSCARDMSVIPYDRVNKGSGKKYQSDVYVCRKDEKGKRLDKKAMYITSKALGHNRINVIADHYLRNM